MAGYNFNFYLDDAQSISEKVDYKDTTVILFVRRGQFKIKYRTSIKVKPDQWDTTKQEVKRNKIAYASDNDYLDTIKSFAKEVFYEKSKVGEPLTHSGFKSAMDVKLGLNQVVSNTNFLIFIEQFIKESKVTKELNTQKGYVTTQNHLVEFYKNSGISPDFESINMDFYHKFLTYLMVKMKHSKNTAGTNIKNVKVFLREAFERQLHSNTMFQNRKFKTVDEVTESIALNMDEIEQLYALDLSKDHKLDRVRDIFVVACMTGLRYSDFSKVTKDNIKNGMLEIIPEKTKGISPDPIVIPRLGKAPMIFEKYLASTGKILPRILSNQKMNDFIKLVGKEAKFNELLRNPHYKEGNKKDEKEFVPKYSLITMHTARRSFATNAYLMDIPILDIMRITGHKTIKSFMRYIRMSNKDAAIRVQAGWQNRLEEKTDGTPNQAINTPEQ